VASFDDLLEVLEGARRYEGYISSLCPRHEDTRPSFMVWPDYFKCYACGFSGKTEDLFHLVRGRVVHHIQPAPFRNPWRKWIESYGGIGLSCKAAHEHLPSEYLQRRGITPEWQDKLSLGYLDNWYTIPIRSENGKIVGGIARRGEDNTSPAKYVTPPGQNNRQTLYVPSWELLHRSKEVIVTFGILDAISVAMYGMGAISIIGLFVDHTSFDFLRKNIFVVPDFREEKFAVQLAAKLGWRGHVPKIVYPDGSKDLSDVFVRAPDQFAHIIEGIKTWQYPGKTLAR
jgi:hypothetical protein